MEGLDVDISSVVEPLKGTDNKILLLINYLNFTSSRRRHLTHLMINQSHLSTTLFLVASIIFFFTVSNDTLIKYLALDV